MLPRAIWLAVLTFAAAAWSLASATAAADRTCTGTAEGAAQSLVNVRYVIDAAGAVKTRNVLWAPPHKGERGFPKPTIAYDIDASGSWRPTHVHITAYVQTDPLPKSTAADVVLTLDGERSWRKRWESYTGQRQRGFKVEGKTPTVLFEIIPFAFPPTDRSPAINPDLLVELGAARQATVTIDGNASDEFPTTTFDLAATADRDELFRKALAAADEALKSPETCPESKSPAPD